MRLSSVHPDKIHSYIFHLYLLLACLKKSLFCACLTVGYEFLYVSIQSKFLLLKQNGFPLKLLSDQMNVGAADLG